MHEGNGMHKWLIFIPCSQILPMWFKELLQLEKMHNNIRQIRSGSMVTWDMMASYVAMVLQLPNFH